MGETMTGPERELHYSPDDGEWISRRTVSRVLGRLFVDSDPQANKAAIVEYFLHHPDMQLPRAADIDSPHSQDCVVLQRTTLCALVYYRAWIHPDAPVEHGQVVDDYVFTCECPAGPLEMKAVVRRINDDEFEIGWLKPGASML